MGEGELKIVNFIVPVPLGPWGVGQKLPKIDQFSKIFFSISGIYS
jgi:hypothetical protein